MRTSPLTAAFDRGPAKYFHGRKQILHDFNELVARAIQAKSGTIFLIQGAPGAGKSALLHECAEQAKSAKWEIAKIAPVALWNPGRLRQYLGLKNIKIEGGSAHLGVPGIAQADISAERSPHTVETLLQAGKAPLLLTLDEAQTLGMENEFPANQIHNARSVLNAIHNGELGRSVILLAVGLGTTGEYFRSFGISRFAKRCLVELGALEKEAEREVLRDWLTKEGGAKGDPTAWIDAIAQETQGWPQHILSYVESALEQLDADKSVMTPEGLNVVLEAGLVSRSKYYDRRAHGFPEEVRQSLARPFRNIPLGESTTFSEIMNSLTQNYNQDKADDIFHQALEKGIIDERSGRYSIPIPSMHDWLVSNYAST